MAWRPIWSGYWTMQPNGNGWRPGLKHTCSTTLAGHNWQLSPNKPMGKGEASTLAQFDGWRFVSLATFRRTGQAVQTILLFVEHEGVLYMRTPAATAKVKRLRHN